MKVKELIEELKKCDSDDIVMYNFENVFTNDNFERIHDCKNDTNASLTAGLMMWRLVRELLKVLYFCVKIYWKNKSI